jgi:hypothetical protein
MISNLNPPTSEHPRAPLPINPILSQSNHATPPHPQPHANAYTSNRSGSQSVLMLPLGIEDTEEDVNTSAALLTMTNNTNLLRMTKFEIAEEVCVIISNPLLFRFPCLLYRRMCD